MSEYQFRHATQPGGGRHDLAAIARVADMMRTPLMPWQRDVCRVTSERHPDDPSRLRYSVVVVTAPRQAGKTAMYGAVQAERSIRHPGHQTMNTAQTGLSARALWLEGVVSQFDAEVANLYGRTPHPRLARLVAKLDRGAGNPSMRLTNGASVGVFAPGPKCLDGRSKVNLIAVDEAFSLDELGGSTVMGSIGPTQIAATFRQLWIFSTKGGPRSVWFNEWLERGRQAVNDPTATMAFFEAAAEPDCNPEHPASLAFHPAIGHTVTRESLWEDRPKFSALEWRRGYLNLDATSSADWIINPDDLARRAIVTTPLTAPDLSGFALAVDLAIDRSAATIIAAQPATILQMPAGETIDGVAIRVLASRPGIDWVPDELTRYNALSPRVILADPAGPTRSLIADLAARRDPIWITSTTTNQYASGCQWTLDALAAGRWWFDADPVFADQARGLVVKPLGGVSAFDPDKSDGPIDAWRAAAIAGHYAATQPMTDQVF